MSEVNDIQKELDDLKRFITQDKQTKEVGTNISLPEKQTVSAWASSLVLIFIVLNSFFPQVISFLTSDQSKQTIENLQTALTIATETIEKLEQSKPQQIIESTTNDSKQMNPFSIQSQPMNIDDLSKDELEMIRAMRNTKKVFKDR